MVAVAIVGLVIFRDDLRARLRQTISPASRESRCHDAIGGQVGSSHAG
jgi:hypothetical protein